MLSLKTFSHIKAKPKQSLYGHSLDTLYICEFWISKNRMVLKNILEKYSVNYEEFIDLLKITSFFHDIGKSTDLWQEYLSENGVWVTHSLISFEILQQIIHNTELKEIACLSVLGHHSQLHNNSFQNISMKEIDQNKDFIDCMLDYFDGNFEHHLQFSKIGKRVIKLRKSIKKIKKIREDLIERTEEERLRCKVIYSLFLNVITLSDNLSSKFYAKKEYFLKELNDEILEKSDFEEINNNFIFDLEDIANLKFVDELNSIQKKVLKSNSDKLIVNADVGIGKTVVALAFGQKLMKENKVNKIIFTLPTRFTSNNLFNDFHEEYNIPREFIGIYHGEVDEFLKSLDENEASNNINEYLQDEKHQGVIYNKPFIISTVDHLLLTLINGYKFSSRSFGNIINSLIVFDELHYYEEHTLKVIGSALRFLNKLNIPHIIMTATLPETIKNSLDEIGDYTFVKGANKTNDNENKPYKIMKADKPLLIDNELNDQLRGLILTNSNRKQIIFVNQVEKCKEVYKSLINCPELKETNLISYHSEYMKKHRRDKEILIRTIFKQKLSANEEEWLRNFNKRLENKQKFKYTHGNGVILVSTQVSELSLNISADMMYMDVAPIDAVIQRGGRLHRRGKEWKDENGSYYMYLFPLNFSDEAENLPYVDPKDKKSVEENILKKSFEIVEDTSYSFSKGAKWLNKLYLEEKYLNEPNFQKAIYDDIVFGKKPVERYGDEEKGIEGSIEIRKNNYAYFDVMPFEVFTNDKIVGSYKENRKFFVSINQWKFFGSKDKEMITLETKNDCHYWFIKYPYSFETGINFSGAKKLLNF